MAVQRQNTNKKTMTKVLVVDKYPLIRRQIAKYIGLQDDMEICAEAWNSTDALKAIEIKNPDIAIIDLVLDGDIQGLKLTQNINGCFPLLKILIMSSHPENVFAEHALKAGAKGYLMKEQMHTTLILAIRRILNGDIYLSGNVTSTVLNTFIKKRTNKFKLADYCLTDRQLKILELIGYGSDVTQIAEKLCLHTEKIEVDYRNIMQKLQINDIHQLKRYAVEWLNGDNLAPLQSEPPPRLF